MTKHIGIVACSYEGASLCYQSICREAPKYLGRHAHPEISMHNHPLAEYMKYIDKDDWQGVANLMLSSAKKLIIAGADILICPDNTIHQAFPFLIDQLTIPWLHIAEAVATVANEKNYKKPGILGTKYLMEGPVYPLHLENKKILYEIPTLKQRNYINDVIFDELVNGIIKEESKKGYLSIIDDLKARGCDAVVLGCTEIPLLVFPHESSLPVLDSTRILASAALEAATA